MSCCAQLYAHKDFVGGNETKCLCSKLPINLNFLLNWGFDVLGLAALPSHVRVSRFAYLVERSGALQTVLWCRRLRAPRSL